MNPIDSFETIPAIECNSDVQSIVDEICSWSTNKKFQLHPKNCHEPRISCSHSSVNYDLVEISGSKLDTVPTFKLLGLHIQDNFKWNTHVAETTRKAAKRVYFLVQLKRAYVIPSKLVHFYWLRNGINGGWT